jgi:hypothetical protein
MAKRATRHWRVLRILFLGGDDAEIVILAANHGQVLDRLRDLGHRQGRSHPLRKPLQEFFLQAGQEPDRLAVFDLSRSVGRMALEEVVAAVAKHSEWYNCARCSLKSDGRICPIYENRERLLGKGDGAQLGRRLGDLVEISRLNGQHLPVRDLLALCANMILGHRDAKDGLMSCGEVAGIQDQGTVDRASVYGNAFGANLPRRRLADRPVFKAMAAFGVGDETTNGADGLLVYGKDDAKLAPDFARLIGSDPIYGATPRLLSAQDRYLEGEEAARLDGGAAPFMEMLQEQRRRLFFTLPPPPRCRAYSPTRRFAPAGQPVRARRRSGRHNVRRRRASRARCQARRPGPVRSPTASDPRCV